MQNSVIRSSLPKISIALACSLLVNGCAVDPRTGQPSFKETFNSDDPCSNNARNIGIVAGSILGAVVGHQMDKKAGKFVGAGAGALLGGLIGNDMDKRRCELAKVAKQYQLDMAFATVGADGKVLDDVALRQTQNADQVKKTAVGMVVSIQDKEGGKGHFQVNSDRLTPQAKEYFAAIAQSYDAKMKADAIADKKAKEDYIRQSAQRKFLLVGHTDDTGPTQLNADLSERRAKAVSRFLSEHGIAKESIYFQGAGESYPVADNATEEGRARNRRVEIVELSDDANFKKYLEARKPNYEYYRPVESGSNTKNADAAPKSERVVSSKAAAKPAAPSQGKSSPPVMAQVPANKALPPTGSSSQSVVVPTPSATNAGARKTSEIDFGGAPLSQAIAVSNIGKVESKKSGFSFISTAYADEPAVLRDCSKDRPRAAGAVKALSNGAEYDTNEHFPGLYGKTWTDRVNGHQIVLNKVSVLKDNAAVTRLPDFKVYKDYNPSVNRNPKPDVSITPAVNTYVGSNGVLYRMFVNGLAGVSCVDVLFNSETVTSAKAGKVLYSHNGQLHVAEFKPAIINK